MVVDVMTFALHPSIVSKKLVRDHPTQYSSDGRIFIQVLLHTARLLFSEYLRYGWLLSSYEVPPSVPTLRLLAGTRQ